MIPKVQDCLLSNQEDYDNLCKGVLSPEDYESRLDKSILTMTNALGGVNFSRLCLCLCRAVYQEFEIYDDVVCDGGRDLGIDAKISFRDAFGFENKLVVQAKTHTDGNKKIGDKLIREFLGSMRVAKVRKGLFITNAFFHPTVLGIQTQENKRKTTLMLVDQNKLLQLLKKYQCGLIKENGYLQLNKKFFFKQSINNNRLFVLMCGYTKI